MKSWNTRYFVLRPGDLSYFKVQCTIFISLPSVDYGTLFLSRLLVSHHLRQGKDQAQHGEVPLNTFFLKDATIVEAPFSKYGKSCVFEIQFSTSSDNKGRTLVLEAESDADRVEWMNHLHTHLQTVSDRSRSCLCFLSISA